jgi:carbamoyltransferase
MKARFNARAVTSGVARVGKVILGLNAFHGDASAALVVDGRIVAAAEEERFRRIKHWAGFPSDSIGYCLREGGLRLQDVDVVALNSAPQANLARKFAYAARQRPDLGLIVDRLRNRKRRAGVEELLAEHFPGERFGGTVLGIEHHVAHLASAFYCSPFERALAISVDGFGDFASAAWGVGDGRSLKVDGRVFFPHSLGVFYQALTQYLGFPHYGDEYKVMGLAPYGERRFMAEMANIVHVHADGTFELDLRFFRHHAQQVDYVWEGGAPRVGALYSDALEALLGPARLPDEPLTARHHDIAASVQGMYEAAFFALVRAQHARHGIDDVVIAGGCGMNSVANGKLRRETPTRRVYVQAGAGDAGGAIGAALEAARVHGDDPRAGAMPHAYLGPAYDGDVLQALLDREGDALLAAGCRVERCAEPRRLYCRTAAAIADGLVVGWFQGRMEFGPRALGNRSILCDPRRADMQARLNLKIKRRESFRPFAPAILREHVGEWFEEDDDVPFMMQVFQVRETRRACIPAVTHVDGSGRLQTVDAATNPRFHGLIEMFFRQTGVPILLNTSFNENEPVVCTPAEALACFLRTRMDVLVLGDYLITRGNE